TITLTLFPYTTLFRSTIFSHNFSFTTDRGVFSKDGLDYGSKTLIEAIKIEENTHSLLDMGCGVGVMGIILKKINPKLNLTMCDRSEEHTSELQSRENL